MTGTRRTYVDRLATGDFLFELSIRRMTGEWDAPVATQPIVAVELCDDVDPYYRLTLADGTVADDVRGDMRVDVLA